MKLQLTLLFGLAAALLGPAGPASAQVTAPYNYNAAAYPQAAYGQAPAAAAQPTYGYPAAPAPSVASVPAAPAGRYAYPNYAPAAPAQPTPGLGGYPTATPRVAQATLPAPSGSATKPMMIESTPAPAVTPPPPVSVAPVETPVHSHVEPTAQSWSSYTAPPTVAGPDCGPGCNTGVAAPAAAPCDTGACGSIDYGYGSGSCGVTSYASSAPSRQWFFGLYGLYLDRSDPGKAITAVEVDTPPVAVPGGDARYYPSAAAGDRFLATSDVDPDFRGGAEIRFGSTFGCAADPCTGCAYQPLAWELGYWAITDDPDQIVLVDDLGLGDADRIYGLQSYAGLEYDRTGTGAAYRPLNDYFDFQDPIDGNSTNDLRVLAVRVQQNFEAQNLELNLWRFGAPSSGYASIGSGIGGGRGGCDAGSCGSGGCGSSCGYDTCGSSCGSSCAAPQRLFISGLAGFRYFRTDETLNTAVQFTNPGVGTDPTVYTGGFPDDDDNNIFSELEVDNELVGFQLGCSINRICGCRTTVFCDTNFGVYNNRMERFQTVFGGGGGVLRFASDGSDADVIVSRNDIAFLGELRCGIGYQVTCRSRLTAAYRVLAASGLATAVGQQTDFSSPTLANHIDNTESLILHGLQIGVETKF